jgi:hypothetical protein
MERRSADDWDGGKLENLAKNYMGMRREIWEGLARATGEKWMVVEQKVLNPLFPCVFVLEERKEWPRRQSPAERHSFPPPYLFLERE